jgi:cytochrome c-type biogenesis protein CcmF
MFNIIGDIAVCVNYVCLVLSFLSILFYFKSINESSFFKHARICFHASTSGIIIMSFILLILIITHQYQYIYIFNHTSNDLPFGLLLSTFYAGQEGSFLFWLLCLSIIGIFLYSFVKKNEIEAPSMATFGTVIVFLLLLVVNKSPFEKVWALFPETIRTGPIPIGANAIAISSDTWFSFPMDGTGLNPLLQNFWMQIHPPILFIGFAFMAIPFIFAISALIMDEYKDWVKYTMPWLLLANFFLGLGLILGAFWAYETLGWGGYWGWDPVENSSLIPWMVGVALTHTLIVQKKNGGLIKTNLLLAIFSFVFVIYSTFLTRSGVLKDSSVHSFAEPGSIVYLLLFLFLFTMLILGIVLLFFRMKGLSSVQTEYKFLSKEFMLMLSSIVISISALIICIGTSYPIVSKAAIDISFYNNWNIPLIIIINILNGLSIITAWNNDSKQVVLKKMLTPLVISIILIIMAYGLGIVDFAMILIVWSSFFALAINIEKLCRNFRVGFLKTGVWISHIGLALFFVGIVGSGKYDQSAHINLIKGEPASVFGYEFTFLDKELFDNGKKSYFNISVKELNGDESLLRPVMFLAGTSGGSMKIPDIKETFIKDLYFAPVSLLDSDNSNTSFSLEIEQDDFVKYFDYEIAFIDFSMDMTQMMQGGEFSITANLKLKKGNDVETMNLVTMYDKQSAKYITSFTKDGKYGFELERIIRAEKSIIAIRCFETDKPLQNNNMETLTAEISIKPAINLFWIGSILMLLGFVIAYVTRRNELKVNKNKINERR